MIAQKNSFVFGYEKNGLKNERALELFDEIESLPVMVLIKAICDICNDCLSNAYLKANYPLNFYVLL